MDELKTLIAGIEQKIARLQLRAESLEMENRQLKSRLQETETALGLQKRKIKELENKNSILKVSGSINRNGEKQQAQKARAVIDGLVREIDRCLLLLDD